MNKMMRIRRRIMMANKAARSIGFVSFCNGSAVNRERELS
jgi:hypothetical protein